MRQVIRMQVAVVVAVVIVGTGVGSDWSSIAAADVRIVVRVAADIVLRVMVIAVMVDDMVLVVLVTEVAATAHVVVVRVMMVITGDGSGTRRLDLQHDLSHVVLVLISISGRRSLQISQWVQALELLLKHVFQVTQLVAASGTGHDRLIKGRTAGTGIAAVLLVLLAFDVRHEDGTGGRGEARDGSGWVRGRCEDGFDVGHEEWVSAAGRAVGVSRVVALEIVRSLWCT